MDLNAYQCAAEKTAIYNRDKWAVMYPAIGLANEAGEALGKIKKVLRDKDGQIDEESREAILKEVGDCLWYIAMVCSDLGEDLEDLAADNLDKLESRKNRGVLGGSGDYR